MRKSWFIDASLEKYAEEDCFENMSGLSVLATHAEIRIFPFSKLEPHLSQEKRFDASGTQSLAQLRVNCPEEPFASN